MLKTTVPASLLSLLLLSPLAFGQNDPVNAELVGQWDGYFGTYGDIWADGQYAYIAHFGHSGVDIVDLSDPSDPTLEVAYLVPPPNSNASAQDVKVAGGLLFIGLEGNNEASVHIVDVRDPKNPVPLVDISIAGFNSIHNVFYYEGFLYMVDSGSPRIGIIDLTTLDPDNPPAESITTTKWILDGVGMHFVHDITVQDGRLYACAWDSGLWIFNVTNVAKALPTFLGQTPDGGNNTHSCWPSTAGDFVVTGEERSGGGIKVYRITDNGGSLDLELTDSLALPDGEAFSVHNMAMVGHRLYNAWYGAGLQVFDIDPSTGLLEFVASYDSAGGSAWGVYPFLGEDQVLISDMSNGLLIINVDLSNADLNGDGEVDAADLAILLGAWGPCGDCGDCPADLDGDCEVNAADLAILLGAWG